MKKNFSKILSVLLAFIMVVSVIPMLAFNASATEYTSGYYKYKVSNSQAIITDVDEYIGSVVTIPSTLDGYTITEIGYEAFYDCNSLTSVTIPDSVTTIGDYAFSFCHNLKNVTIPNSVTTIGESSFLECNSLTNITIPNSVTTIGSWAFAMCNNLISVTIPDSVTSIGNSPFSSCDNLTSITTDNNNQYYSSDEYGVLFNKNKTLLIQYPAGNTRTSYTLPNSVTEICCEAFSECDSLTSVTIPNSVTTIGDSAFSFCYNLRSVTIPDSVTTIDDFAFSFCGDLTSITIPNSVTTIGSWAFTMSSLTSITIPDSVTTIGDHSFYNCHNLADVYYSGTKEQWNEISIGDYNDKLLKATTHFNYCHHEYDSVVTEPTCTEKGYTTYTCECGNAYVDNYVDATGHSEGDNEGNCSTCGEHICDHDCHKSGIAGFFWKIVCFFSKLFGSNKFCVCGKAHY